ncbi:ABC transporter substrate-binding protein [Azospirillum agricola]|uniref:ABC transporter substrate-binding protein n=1 Tax=Azospirillum agricola TaxID=1720247 RepID=UPI000A0F3E98|nr:ABC transporter substrate-binding protein [Azospirillum agricola]SMH31918.1 ABC-type branched-chain amino acid transport system, substrate-binding protein [Azospirillum lipoferum]
MRAAVLVLMAILLLAGRPASAEKRVALVIGNAAYEAEARLGNPVNDARAMSAALRRLGFEVTDGYDLTIDRMLATLRDFSRTAGGADVALVYYAGHGLQVEGENYLLPVDARLNREQELRRQAVALDEVLAELRDARRLRLVILDACRNNPFAKRLARSMGQRSVMVGRGLARIDRVDSDTLVAFATGADSIADDGIGQANSPFTRALLEHLEAPGLDIRLVFGRVRDSVRMATKNEQTPFVYNSLGGDAYYLKPGAPPPASAPAADREALFWTSVKDSTNPADFDAYLSQFPNGTFASLARSRREALARAAEKPAAVAAAVPPQIVAPPPQPRSPVTVAVAGPMTGQYAIFGEQMRKGAELAVADINARGGIGGRSLKLEVGDDACDPKQAVAVANQFARVGVKFVAGHFCSGSSIPASQVYAEEGILQITPASTNPKLTEQGLSNVFRVCGRDDQQGIVAGRYIAAAYRNRSVAVLHDRSAYGKNLADTARATLTSRGVSIALYDSITAGERSYAATVEQIRRSGAGVVYFGGYHTEAGLIAREMRAAGLRVVLVGADALVTNDYWAITGTSGEGTLMTFGPDPREKPAAQAVVKRFRAQGYEPEGYALYTYAAVQVFAAAATAAGTTDAPRLGETLRRQRFSTVLGDLGFDAKGDRSELDYVFYKWSGGAYSVCTTCTF